MISRGAAPRAAVIALLLFGALGPMSALAYPTMIRHGYPACAQCHADPSGGSLLTEYGRAQGELLLRTRYGEASEEEEEEPGKVKDFLFGLVPLPGALSLGGDIRTMTLLRPQNATDKLRVFPMQADLVGQVEMGPVRANASVGYAGGTGALPASIMSGTGPRLISRHHWLGYSFAEGELLLRAGRMNLPFGVRKIEHLLWVRAATRTDINEAQQHGLALAYTTENLRGELMLIAGNFQLSPDVLRERGYSLYLERALSQSAAVGISSLITRADREAALPGAVFRHAHGAFTRVHVGGGLVLLGEADFLLQAPEGRPNLTGFTGMIQADYELLQGVHVIATGETLNPSVADVGWSWGGWLGVAWFFAPHSDLRVDVSQRSEGTTGASVSSTALMLQLHVYL